MPGNTPIHNLRMKHPGWASHQIMIMLKFVFLISQRIYNPAHKKYRIRGGLSDNIHE
jgi:hypothetical protein